MTDTQPAPGPELPAASTQDALTWLMTFDYNHGTEVERTYALAVVQHWFMAFDGSVSLADIMAPHRGARVADPKSFRCGWEPEAPTPAGELARSLWPLVREMNRLMLMRAGLRLAAVAAQDDDTTDVAHCGEAAARIFAVLDEATA